MVRVVTVTSKRMMTIPADIARKYGIRKSTRLEVIDTGKGILLVPIVPLEELFGVDDRDFAREMISEIHKERRREAVRD